MIENHYKELFEKIKDINENSCLEYESISKVHHFLDDIEKWKDILILSQEPNMITIFQTELQYSILCNNGGLYRQGISSLRLCYELIFGFIYFSAFRLKFQEWKSSQGDIRWSLIMGDKTGVLSEKFVKAFFPDFSEEIQIFREKCRLSYREMSEFIHGNYHTWIPFPKNLQYDPNMQKKWFQHFEVLKEFSLLSLHYRFFNDYKDNSERIVEINKENLLNHKDTRL
jgi:hypothetical protein